MDINKKYKYWFFYIKPKYIDLVTTENDDSLLYAYTDNKEYAELFESQRNMDKFFTKKRKIDKEEVNFLASQYMREYLIKKDIKTHSKGIGSKIIDYSLILTNTEYHILQSSVTQISSINMWKYTWLNPYIFNNEYFQILKEIEFVEKFNTIARWKKSNNESNNTKSKIQPDYLAIFIKEFGFLLTPEKGD